MRLTEEKMGPVLRAFRDQVTFLKHNLNAKAMSSLNIPRHVHGCGTISVNG